MCEEKWSPGQAKCVNVSLRERESRRERENFSGQSLPGMEGEIFPKA